MIVERKKRSVEIPKDKLTKIRKAYKSFTTKVDAQEATGIYYRVLDRLEYQNTCSPETLTLIETFLQSQKVA